MPGRDTQGERRGPREHGPAEACERLSLRGVSPPAVFDLLAGRPKWGSILNRFTGAWWRLLADGRFFFEPSRLADALSNSHLLRGVYEERGGAFILRAESYRGVGTLLALEGFIRPGQGQFVLDCLFFEEGSESLVLHLTQPLTGEDARRALHHARTLKGVPVPALYDILLSGRTTSGRFGEVQAGLYTEATAREAAAGEPDELSFNISDGSTPDAAAEQNGRCMLIPPPTPFAGAASGLLPSNQTAELSAEDGRLRLTVKGSPAYAPTFSWWEVEEGEGGGGPPRRITFCDAREVSFDCRVTGDTVAGEIRAQGLLLTGDAARYEATFTGRRAADEPQALARLERKIELLSAERSWRDTDIFRGEWQSRRFGLVRLRQRGRAVTGVFSGPAGGGLKGRATEHRLTFDWEAGGRSGRGVLRAARGGQFLAGHFAEEGGASSVEFFYAARPSSSLVARTLRDVPDPHEWHRLADSLKSLNRHAEALALYERAFEVFGEERRQSPPFSERWSWLLSYEWGALLSFMNCFQMRNPHLADGGPRSASGEGEGASFERLLRAFEHATRLQKELYSLAEKARAEEGVRLLDFGARLSRQIESWRRSLRDEAGRLRVLDSSQPALTNLLKLLVSAGNHAEALVVSEDARARALADLMQKRIYREGALPALTGPRAEDIEELLAGTTATAAPVELEALTQTARDERATIVEYFLCEDELWTWVVSPRGEINFHGHRRPGLLSAVRALVVATRAGLGVQTREAAGKRTRRRAGQSRAGLAELYELLVGPVARWLPEDESETVIFVPHGTLFLIPFPALFDGRRFLIERHSIAVAPSISFVETARRMGAARKSYPPGELVIGDPLMPAARRGGRGPARQLPQLEFARREAEEIARKLQTDALLGAEARKDRVVELLPGRRLIHFATHGLLDEAGPEDGMLGAIALAPSDADDGLLTATEIAGLHLTARLVVMSACNTGRGRLSADGILGLMRSFLTAGAECVVASLWAVADHSTQKLMVEFYDHLLAGLPIVQAMRRAMLTMLLGGRYDTPLYWGAFTVTGRSQATISEFARDPSGTAPR